MADNNPIALKIIKEEPALYRHSVATYEAMLNEATDEEVQGATFKVFRGYIGDAFKAAKASNQYYPAVMGLLTDNECIVIVERGWRNSPACVVLLSHPDDAAVSDDAKRFTRGGRSGLTGAAVSDMLAQRVDNLTKQIGSVNLVDLVTLVDKLDKRLTKLEQQITQVARQK